MEVAGPSNDVKKVVEHIKQLETLPVYKSNTSLFVEGILIIKFLSLMEINLLSLYHKTAYLSF